VWVRDGLPETDVDREAVGDVVLSADTDEVLVAETVAERVCNEGFLRGIDAQRLAEICSQASFADAAPTLTHLCSAA